MQKWAFNDAPRLLRIQAVDKIPELLEALLKKAAELSEKMTKKADEIVALTDAISSAVEPASKPRGRTIQEPAGTKLISTVPKVAK